MALKYYFQLDIWYTRPISKEDKLKYSLLVVENSSLEPVEPFWKNGETLFHDILFFQSNSKLSKDFKELNVLNEKLLGLEGILKWKFQSICKNLL